MACSYGGCGGFECARIDLLDAQKVGLDRRRADARCQCQRRNGAAAVCTISGPNYKHRRTRWPLHHFGAMHHFYSCAAPVVLRGRRRSCFANPKGASANPLHMKALPPRESSNLFFQASQVNSRSYNGHLLRRSPLRTSCETQLAQKRHFFFILFGFPPFEFELT